jgi:hypothetical protein
MFCAAGQNLDRPKIRNNKKGPDILQSELSFDELILFTSGQILYLP